MPRLNLDGASAIVTGGASGIGEAAARQLAALGARAVIADLQEDKGTAVANEIGGLFVKCDVSSEEDGTGRRRRRVEMGPLRARQLGRPRPPGAHDRPQQRADGPVGVRLRHPHQPAGLVQHARLSAAAMAKTEPLDADGQRGAIVNMASVAALDGQDRPGRLLRQQGRHRRHDAADRPRPVGGRHPGQHHRRA
ncbi:MAG: SDR family NAD(P)-dependent oxidoreductase [Ilumatobacteraceae bacterium]